jgi:hypothetical protein
MADGIGHITAVYSRNMVCHLIPDCILFTKFIETVYYRSKDSKLPDAVPGLGPGGEVFFDVRSKVSSESICTPPFLCQPNVLSSDGSVSLSTASFSRNGKWFAYGLSRSVRHLVTVIVQGNIVSVGKRLHKHLHSLH